MKALPWPTSFLLTLTLVGSLSGCGRTNKSTPVSQGNAPASNLDSAAERTNVAGFPLEGPRFQGSALKPKRGSSFAHGTLIVFNRGRARLRLERVTPVDVHEGLRFLGARVSGLDRTIGFDQASAWPVASAVFGRVAPPENYILEPTSAPDADRGYEILLGYQVPGSGRATVKGVRIEYTDLGNDSHKSITFDDTLAVCPGAAETAACPVEQGGP